MNLHKTKVWGGPGKGDSTAQRKALPSPSQESQAHDVHVSHNPPDCVQDLAKSQQTCSIYIQKTNKPSISFMHSSRRPKCSTPAATICCTPKLRGMQHKASSFISAAAAHLFTSASTVSSESTLPMDFHCFNCSLKCLVLPFSGLSLGYFRCYTSSHSKIAMHCGQQLLTLHTEHMGPGDKVVFVDRILSKTDLPEVSITVQHLNTFRVHYKTLHSDCSYCSYHITNSSNI